MDSMKLEIHDYYFNSLVNNQSLLHSLLNAM